MNRSGGLLRSVAGQGHARFLRVTLPRGASDQRKRPAAGSNRYAVACVPIMVGIAVPIMVGIMVVIVVSDRVAEWRSRNCSSSATWWPELLSVIAGGGDGPGGLILQPHLAFVSLVVCPSCSGLVAAAPA